QRVVALADVAERREVVGQVVGHELVDALRAAEALELELAQLPGRMPDPARRLLRHEHLAALRRPADARGPMDVAADVAVLGGLRLAAVEAHAPAHPLARRPALRLDRALDDKRCRRGRLRAVEHAEELVAAAVDLAPARLRHRLALELARAREHVRVVA